MDPPLRETGEPQEAASVHILHQSSKAFLNVGSHGRTMHFVVAFVPPPPPAHGVRSDKALGSAVQWSLTSVRVLQISSTGAVFDRSESFKTEDVINRVNGEANEFVHLILLVPETVGIKVHLPDCKSNKYRAEFVFSIKAYGETFEQKVRSNVIYVGSKSKNASAEQYAEFISGKMEYIEGVSRIVDQLRERIKAQDPDTLSNYIANKIVAHNEQEPIFESDNDILQRYNGLKRGRTTSPADMGAPKASFVPPPPALPPQSPSVGGEAAGSAGPASTFGAFLPPSNEAGEEKSCDGGCAAVIAQLRREVEDLKAENRALREVKADVPLPPESKQVE